MTPTLDQMKQRAIAAVRDAAATQGIDPGDVTTTEIFEEIIPANNHMLIDLLKDNLGLGYPEEMPFFDDGPSAFQVISHAISEHLRDAVLEWLEDYELERLAAELPDRMGQADRSLVDPSEPLTDVSGNPLRWCANCQVHVTMKPDGSCALCSGQR